MLSAEPLDVPIAHKVGKDVVSPPGVESGEVSRPAELGSEVEFVKVWVAGVLLPVFNPSGPPLEEIPWELVCSGAARDD